MKVENMTSHNGNKIPNQFIITDDDGREFFQSYQTIIARRDGTIITLDKNKWNYSTTTGKYRNQFLGMDIDQTRKAIKGGRIKLEDLNNGL